MNLTMGRIVLFPRPVEFSDRPQTASIISDFSRDPPEITASSGRTTRGWAGADTTVGNGNVNGDNVNGDIVNGDITTSHYGHGTI